MIRLAANGSPILKDLLDVGDLPLDFIKCPLSGNSCQEVTTFRPYRPVLLHGWGPNYWIGQRGVPEPDLLRELMALSGSPCVSTHLSASPEDFDGDLTPAGVLERACGNVQTLRGITDSPALLENVPHLPWGKTPRFVTDPAFFAEVLKGSGAGMLLDLAHAQVSAWHRGEDLTAHLEAMPLGAVAEVHLSRPARAPEGLRDRHLALEEEDYALLTRWLPRLPGLRTVTLEYGGLNGHDDPRALRAQLLRLHAILEDFHAAGK